MQWVCRNCPISHACFARFRGDHPEHSGNSSCYLTVPKMFEKGGYEYEETLLVKEAKRASHQCRDQNGRQAVWPR